MNKEEMVLKVSADTGFTQGIVSSILESLLSNITEDLAAGNKVQLYGFGTFEPKQVKARVGRNPRKNEPVEIPARIVPSFKPGNRLKKIVTKNI